MAEPYLIKQNELPEKYISIHTSDRNSYRRCRRRWDFTSELRQHLTPKIINPKFYAGTAIHFSLEDYHGYNLFGHPYNAFQAYHNAFKEYATENETEDNPAEFYEEETEFVQGIFDHYTENWLSARHLFDTLWIDDKPLVEVEFSIYVPELSDYFKTPVVYQGKFDRVAKDDIGRLWIVEYKTVASFDSDKLQTDPQCSNYAWASQYILPEPAEGIAFIQFLKDCPNEPRILKNGQISTATNQKTTLKKFRDALIKKYGCEPTKYNDVIKALMEKEDDNGDAFIRIDYVRRNKYHRANEYPKILAEGFEMLNPDAPIYPNPTKDCSWDCGFKAPCLAMDAGMDWEYMIKQNYEKKKGDDYPWEKKIKYPQMQNQ